MSNTPPRRTLRARPDLDQLKRQAKELLDAFRAGDADAVAEIDAYMRGATPATFALHDAQLVLARAHGFASWPKLKAHVEGVTLHRAADAVRAGDLAEVRRLLDARPELVHVDMAGDDEHRLLHYAVLARNPEMTRLVMQYGADPHKGIYPHRDATSALTIATDRGYDEIVAIIKEEETKRRTARAGGAAVADIDRLAKAFVDGARAAAIALLEQHPELVNARQRVGWTPLHIASAVLDDAAVEWLLRHGADVNARGDADRTPIDVAAEMHRSDDVKRFRRVANTLRRHGAELTPASAVALGEAQWVRDFHARSSLANAVRYSTLEPTVGLLRIAAKHDRPDMIALLLELGLDPNERTLLEDVDGEVYTEGMPLHHCASSGKLALAKQLLDAGADPNAAVYAGGSATHEAYTGGNAKMIELLTRYGGVPNGLTVGSLRLVDDARRMLDDDAAGRLPEAARVPGGSSIVEDLLWGAAGAGSIEIVQMCLARIDWPRDDHRWYSMLREPMYIGMKRSRKERANLIECFRLILARHDPGASGGGTRRRTLLHDLSGSRHSMPGEDRVTIGTMLIDAGARPDVRDEILESTPLGWACRWGHVELVKLLLARGADPVEADAAPWATPRAWAASHGHSRIARMLDRESERRDPWRSLP